ncbi:MAG: hypothetical protein HYR97_03310 [Candidatus Melainabacteria bacterium]|nr:hypothetical protein [Candidatus Melainabacteria bacterium]
MKTNLKYLFGFITAFIVFIFYLHTLSFPSKHFDEQIIFNESIYPIPHSFSELIDYLRYFGLNHYFEASNPFYSSISNLRLDPINTLVLMVAFLIFQKNLFAYHLLALIFHALNSFLLFLILNKVSARFIQNEANNLKYIIISALSLMWALHPVNVEAVLLTTNWIAIFSYSFCFAILLFYIKTLNQELSLLKRFFIFTFYLIPLFIIEYSVTIPLILFVYTLAYLMNKNQFSLFKKNLKQTIIKIAPLFTALAVFIISFILLETKTNISRASGFSIFTMLERVIWFSSQIFVHYLKILAFPIHLSIDQTSKVFFSNQLYAPYAVGCLFCSISMIFILILSFRWIKQISYFLIFISLSPFIISLIPFLHILSPTYCIASERYLYFPSAMLIFGISHSIFYLQSKTSRLSAWKINLLLIIISTLTFSYSTRAYVRTLDWKDSFSLHKSALKESGNGLFKGLRQSFLGGLLLENKGDKRAQIKGRKYIRLATYTLENYLSELESDKLKYQRNLPSVLKFYGLDPKTMQAKTAYLLTHTRLALDETLADATTFLQKYMTKSNLTDTQVLDFYLGLLFATQNLDEAEKVVNYASKQKISPTISNIKAELYKKKYKDYIQAENYLLKSFKLFPYDVQTLDALRRVYLDTNKLDKFAYFSFLHGIRTHSKYSLQDAYNVYVQLNNIEMAKKALQNLEINNS